jgi:hypothetical protein
MQPWGARYACRSSPEIFPDPLRFTFGNALLYNEVHWGERWLRTPTTFSCSVGLSGVDAGLFAARGPVREVRSRLGEVEGPGGTERIAGAEDDVRLCWRTHRGTHAVCGSIGPAGIMAQCHAPRRSSAPCLRSACCSSMTLIWRGRMFLSAAIAAAAPAAWPMAMTQAVELRDSYG